jgi:hypothetical protein
MAMFDIIGDIHGHAAELRRLLESLGYVRHGDGYRHSDRKAVLVGDFVDRGPAIGEAISIASATVEAGDWSAVMGNLWKFEVRKSKFEKNVIRLLGSRRCRWRWNWMGFVSCMRLGGMSRLP